jgi:hypothetical protein
MGYLQQYGILCLFVVAFELMGLPLIMGMVTTAVGSLAESIAAH